MKYKTIACHVCNGAGFIVKTAENKAWSENCVYCHGTGKEEVPMTNADRIRFMTDEELASILLENDYCRYCDYFRDDICEIIEAGPDQPLGDYCRAAALNWLRKPADDNETGKDESQ